MTISPEIWDVFKIVLAAYVVYVLQKTDRNQVELFNRMRKIELKCAANHGLNGEGTDEDS